jgi:hypothetical protein
MFQSKVYAKLMKGPKKDPLDKQSERYREEYMATAKLHAFGNQAPYFSMTVSSPHSGGCQHELLARLWPEWAKYIKWHLTSTAGPMHYIANTLYHAGDRDYNGLREGERKQLVNGKTKLPVWHLVVRDKDGVELENPMGGQHWVDATECPKQIYTIAYEPVWIKGEGKKRELAYARSSAVWPEATDEELSLPREELEKLLVARHQGLMDEFRRDMTELFGDQIKWEEIPTKDK